MTRKLTTITGDVITISSNRSKRTFTIKRRGSTYRTFKMSKLEFLECENMTGNDWNQFLRTNQYRVIK